MRDAARDVERPRRPPGAQKQGVGPDDVPDIAEIAPRREVADPDLRTCCPRSIAAISSAEAGNREARVAAGSEVVEGPHDRDVERRLPRGEFGRGLRDPVRRERRDRFVLGDRQAFLGDGAVDLGGGHDQKARVGGRITGRHENVDGARRVDVPDSSLRVPRLCD